MATIVIGAQWGDEGKGKLVDILSRSAELCARCAGGNNAGHTIVAEGVKYDFHILPSGLLNPACMNLIGSGVVVHVPSFFAELEAVQRKGLESQGRIVISDRAHVVLDLHQLADGLEEVELGGGSIGTTRKGIGPAYSCKAARSGVRVAEVFDREAFEKKLRTLAEMYRKRFGDRWTYDVDAEIESFNTYREKLAEYVVDAVPLMKSAQASNANVLIEGANAIMLDVDYGTYPYVTSSNTGVGGAITGLALNPFKIKEIIGVVKAYTTRVGGGPFPTEQLNEVGSKLQEIGHEYGVTTGRKRRCGWLDLVVIKYSTDVNHYTCLNLTKLDILDTFSEIRIGTSYLIDNQPLDSFPADLTLLNRVEINYTTLPGWQTSTQGITHWDDLPVQARKYVEFIEEFVGVRIRYIGTGVGRGDIIVR